MDLLEFDPNILNAFDYFSMSIIASRGAGKSTVCRLLLYHMLRSGKILFKNIWILSGSDDATFEHFNKIPDIENIGNVLATFNKDNKGIIVIDDFSHKRTDLRKSELVDMIYSNGRHHFANIILISHSKAVLNPLVRNNTDIFVFCSYLDENERRIMRSMVSEQYYKDFYLLLEKFAKGDRINKIFSQVVYVRPTSTMYKISY